MRARIDGTVALPRTVDIAVQLGCSDQAAVRDLLMTATLERPSIASIPIGTLLAQDDRPLPSVAAYDRLVSAHERDSDGVDPGHGPAASQSSIYPPSAGNADLSLSQRCASATRIRENLQFAILLCGDLWQRRARRAHHAHQRRHRDGRAYREERQNLGGALVPLAGSSVERAHPPFVVKCADRWPPPRSYRS